MTPKEWLDQIFTAAASDFTSRCTNGDSKLQPISNWEIEKLREGVSKGHFSITGSVFQSPDKKEYCFFGLNREYFEHFAMLAEALSWEIPNSKVEFEYNKFDLMILVEEKAYLGIEVKKSKKDAEYLLSEMQQHMTAPNLEILDRGIDGLRKVKYLLQAKPPPVLGGMP